MTPKQENTWPELTVSWVEGIQKWMKITFILPCFSLNTKLNVVVIVVNIVVVVVIFVVVAVVVVVNVLVVALLVITDHIIFSCGQKMLI